MLITSYVFWRCVLTLDQWTQRWLVSVSSDHFLRFAESFRWLDLPDYLPTVRNINGNHERNYLIEQYFHLGLNYSEIISFLLLRHGVRLSLHQLKRILRSRGLRRRKIQSLIDRVVNAVD